MAAKILFVGGCTAPFHQLEPAEGPVRAALEGIGLEVSVSGIYHPDGGDDFTGDYGALSAQGLRDYDGFVLFTTGSEELGADVPALVASVRGGKALIGIHCAADSFGTHQDYVAALGGRFRQHPAPLDIAVEFTDAAHPVTRGLEPFTVQDELYLFRDYDPARVHLLAQTRSFDDGGPVPVCWAREEGAGRVFYLSLGHFPAVMAAPAWQSLFQRGVLWALGRDPSRAGS